MQLRCFEAMILLNLAVKLKTERKKKGERIKIHFLVK